MGDLAITPANVQFVSGTVADGFAGEALTAGDTLYKDTSGLLQQAITAGPFKDVRSVLVGIALNDALTNQPIRYQLSGVIALGAGTEGVIYIVSANTDGKMGLVADLIVSDLLTIVGVGNDNNGIALSLFTSGSEVQ